MKFPVTRRKFIRDGAGLTAGLALARPVPAASGSFASAWSKTPDRVWIGPEYWANPLQDWRVASGRVECVNAAADRNLHLLTRQLVEKPGNLEMGVTIGRVGGGALSGKGSAGFRVGISGPLREYRNNALFGAGIDAGFADGKLFVGETTTPVELKESVELRLTAQPSGNGYQLTLVAHEPGSAKILAQVAGKIEHLSGNVALVANYKGTGTGTFWFSSWSVAGSKVDVHEDHVFGPILFSHYSLHGGVLKMTAQMPPIGRDEPQAVKLQASRGKKWETLAEEPIHPDARTATFRITGWNALVDVPYRLVWRDHEWRGTVRRDPVERPVLTVGDVSCNIHSAFPNAGYVANMAKLNPDLLAFVGDQFYESTGGYGTTRAPLDTATLDYLRKWYVHGWTWRELTRDRPSVSLPDDHDVYQGNIWGEGGAPKAGTQEKGGYEMPAAWVNVVYRTQTSHHPDPFDPTPAKQGISVYYGPMTYGRVSFAVLADRMFKSGPEGKVPPSKGDRGDHVTDPKFDPKTADVPGVEMLGERQLKFLAAWAADWKGADMKAVISQTIFAAMATTHGGNRERLRADYDANGWPQTARNKALREIRKAFAMHIAGDQHLPGVIHYGVDEARDAGIAFAGPAVNVGYPRWWEPTMPGKNRAPGAHEHTGDHIDHFGNHMAVLAFANGAEKPAGRNVLQNMHERASGLGLVRFDKRRRKVTIECWPFLADPTKPNTQFPGWPVVVDVMDNYARKATAHLPKLHISGAKQPVVQVVEESGEILYTLRVVGPSFQPPVFAPGRYLVRVSEPDSGKSKELPGLEATTGNKTTLKVVL